MKQCDPGSLSLKVGTSHVSFSVSDPRLGCVHFILTACPGGSSGTGCRAACPISKRLGYETECWHLYMCCIYILTTDILWIELNLIQRLHRWRLGMDQQFHPTPFTWGLFWPSGIVVACVCACVCVSVCPAGVNLGIVTQICNPLMSPRIVLTSSPTPLCSYKIICNRFKITPKVRYFLWITAELCLQGSGSRMSASGHACVIR